MKYTVEIDEKKPFKKKLPNGKLVEAKKTAMVTSYEDDGVPSQLVEYGFIDMVELMAAIGASTEINLDYCFIDSLNLNGENIPSFSANHAFFNGETDFGSTTFLSEASFNHTIFNDKADFVQTRFEGKSSFRNSVFIGYTDFTNSIFIDNARFYHTTFNDVLDLTCARFLSQTDYHKANFKVDAYFVGAEFCTTVDFQEATFGAYADFSETRFKGVAIFREVSFIGSAVFNQAASFRNATFESYAIFTRSNFNNKADFSDATFIGSTHFSASTFSTEACFLSATFSSDLQFDKCYPANTITFEGALFRGHAIMTTLPCDFLNLNACIVEKSLDLQGSIIIQLSLKNIKLFGNLYLDWQKDNIKNAILNNLNDKNRHCSHWDQANQFRFLKENFRSLGQYDDEDEAYVAYRQEFALYNFDKLYTKFSSTPKNLWIKIQLHLSLIKWFCTDTIGKHGTSPKRIAVALVINIFLFGLIYSQVGGIEINTKQIHPFIAYWYFSAITSFTVGYGDFSPTSNLTAVLSCIESFIGVFLMSYFVVAFSRKVLR